MDIIVSLFLNKTFGVANLTKDLNVIDLKNKNVFELREIVIKRFFDVYTPKKTFYELYKATMRELDEYLPNGRLSKNQIKN